MPTKDSKALTHDHINLSLNQDQSIQQNPINPSNKHEDIWEAILTLTYLTAIFPPPLSSSPRRADKKEDFPEPTGPTIPTYASKTFT